MTDTTDDIKDTQESLDTNIPRKIELGQEMPPEGLESISRILEVYSRYSVADFADDPAQRLEAYAETHTDFEKAAAALTIFISRKYVSGKGLLKAEPLTIIADIFEKIGDQNYGTSMDRNSPVVIAILRLRGHIFAYLIYMMASKEPIYRRLIDQRKRARARKEKQLATLRSYAADKTKVREFWALYGQLERDPDIQLSLKGGGFYSALKVEKAVGEDMFDFIDSKQVPRGTSSERVETLTVMATTYGTVQQCAKIFATESANFRPLRESLATIETENDRIFALIKGEATREPPMCTCKNRTLYKNKPLVMQFTPVESGQGETYEGSIIQVNYLDEKFGRAVMEDRQLQEIHRTRMRGDQGINIRTGDFPAFYLDRETGAIRTISLYPDTLKRIAKDSASRGYELIRRNILFYLAQLTCRPETLRKIFGDAFVQGMFGTGTSPGQHPQLPSGKSGPKTDPVTRLYPYGDLRDPSARALAVFTALQERGTIQYITPQGVDLEAETPMTPEEVKRAVELTLREIEHGEVVNHKRLLPLVKAVEEGPGGQKTVTVLTACEPSDAARGRAREHGKVLRRGVEFPELDQVFYPEEVPDLLRQFGITPTEEDPDGLDQLEAMHPGKAFIRYEIWVDPEAAREERIERATAQGQTEGGAETPAATDAAVARAVKAAFRRLPPGAPGSQ